MMIPELKFSATTILKVCSWTQLREAQINDLDLLLSLTN